MTATRFLNLDELPTAASAVSVRHKGVDHPMRVMTVEGFIDQQRRAEQHQKLVEAAAAGDASADVEATEVKAVEIIRDAIVAFFPSLPVNELEVPKLFAVFGWLNEISDKGVEDLVEAAEAVEGNVEGETS